MASIQGFHHIAMNVKYFDKAVEFYGDVLGFEPAYAWGEPGNRAVMIDTGNGNYIEFFEKAELDAKEGSLIHFAMRTDDCGAVLERVRESGAEITVETTDIDIKSDPIYPVRIAFFKGPNGETVELFQERTE